MRRREFIVFLGGALTGFLRAARAEQAKVPRIGFLYPGPQALVAVRLEAMLNGLRAAGYSAPAQVELVVRVAEGDPAGPDRSDASGNYRAKRGRDLRQRSGSAGCGSVDHSEHSDRRARPGDGPGG